ncbi:MAG: carbon-nitrogen hydrolase family protein [Deltaproteobacteria bacterium]|nr:carbon-nitrogen hydrolase family protein [Deltaproteobacteria bacterium]
MSTFLAAVVQLTTTDDVEASLNRACQGVEDAARRGATLVALPENVSFMGSERTKLTLREPIHGPTFQRFSDLARALRIHLIAGTLPEIASDDTHAFNTSVVFGPDGARLGRYRKIHLFDVELGEGATHHESATVEAGTSATVVDTPLGKLGLSICYDVRFPGLYRALARAGAEILSVPAAFTVPTGRDHWEVLIRARAIENQCFLLAPAQVGANAPNRRTFGRSMIVDPWGTVLATCPDAPGIALAEIDLARLRDLRARLPTAAHERPEAYHVAASEPSR